MIKRIAFGIFSLIIVIVILVLLIRRWLLDYKPAAGSDSSRGSWHEEIFKEGRRMKRWEYAHLRVLSTGQNRTFTVYLPSGDEKEYQSSGRGNYPMLVEILNSLGNDGWELVFYDQGAYTFKRHNKG